MSELIMDLRICGGSRMYFCVKDKTPPFVKGRGMGRECKYYLHKKKRLERRSFLWRRRESNAEGEAGIPLKINIFLFPQPHILM